MPITHSITNLQTKEDVMENALSIALNLLFILMAVGLFVTHFGG